MPRIEVTPEEQILILQRRVAEAQEAGIRRGLNHAIENMNQLLTPSNSGSISIEKLLDYMSGLRDTTLIEVLRK